MSSVTQKLDRIYTRTAQLIEVCDSLKRENEDLRKEIEKQKQTLELANLKSIELEEKVRLLKIAKSIEGADEKTLDIKQKINEFVREIDKCVMLLKK